jgi:hypothetical protein
MLTIRVRIHGLNTIPALEARNVFIRVEHRSKLIGFGERCKSWLERNETERR